MFGKSSIKKSLHLTLDVSPLQELVVELDEQNNAFNTVQQLWEALTDGQAEVISGGAKYPPCNDDNDTGCYDLINLECRAVASTSSQLNSLSITL